MKPFAVLILIIIIIATFHFGNCSMIETEAIEGRMSSRKFLLSYRRELSTSSYRVKQFRSNNGGRVNESKQLVPGGPNPLHN
ncbi:hypothetical protein HanRHA438_Chr15g0731741 [Helianthus annuus]|nr:hypothetical protein HanIR_Chr15g0782851 [Helianthus annuus]KAJ0847042.1 hypothetical protein HanRHA438_Chr15g0731741 [Helianthus annuus]